MFGQTILACNVTFGRHGKKCLCSS